MKRALAAALTAALSISLLAGMASAGVQVGVDPVSDRPADSLTVVRQRFGFGLDALARSYVARPLHEILF